MPPTFAATSQGRRSGNSAAAIDRRGSAEFEKNVRPVGIKNSRLVNEEKKEEKKPAGLGLKSIDNALLLRATDPVEERAPRSFEGGLRNTLHTCTVFVKRKDAEERLHGT